MTHARAHLVGRERELAELRNGLQGALAGRGAMFMVAGDPGVGKTALADEIGTEAVAAGALVLWGRAWEGGGAPAYWPWLRIMRRLASERDLGAAVDALGPEASRRLTRLLPGLVPAPVQSPVAHAGPDPGDSQSARFQVFDAVTSLLRAAATQGPLVLILDDLHGADQQSLLLLGFLAVHVRDAPILVIGTYREAEVRLSSQLASLLGDVIHHGRRIPLRGMRERDVAEIVERIAGWRPPDGVVRAIHEATEGNPFFVDEVVRLLSAEGRLDSELRVAGLRIPDGVRETIRHRLAPLPERTRVLLRTASVIGREFKLDTLQRVCGLAPADLDDALGEAVELGVVAERTSAIGAYAFSHGLIRETLYDDIGPQRRSTLHRHVGIALEELYAADPEPHVSELAHHFFVASTAGELAKAIDYSLRAGRRAMSLVAYEEASLHYQRALQAYALQERADVPGRCELLLALGSAQSRAGNARSARDTFLSAAGLARRLEAPELLARAALGYGAGMGGFELGLVDDTLIGLLQEAREALGPVDGPLLAGVLGRAATELYYSDRAAERAALSEAAVAMARRLGDRAAIASSLSARFLTLWGPENSVQRLQIASEVVALGEQARDRELVLRGHVWRIVSLMELGDWVGVDIEVAIHARLADELRDPLHLWQVPLYEANRAMIDGRLGEAERLAAQAFATGRGAQSRNAAQLHAVQLFALRAVQGRLSEVEQSLEEFARRYPAAPVWRAASAFVLAALRRHDAARRAFEALCEGGLAEVPRDGEWLATVALLVSTGASLGDAQRTGELGELLAPYADRVVVAGRGASCFGPVSRFVGMAAAAAGRFDTAIVQYDAALQTAQRWGAEPFVAVIALELCDVLERAGVQGGARRARELHEQGLAIARQLELTGLVERWERPGDAERPATGRAEQPATAPAPVAPAAAPGIPAATTAPDGRIAFHRRGDIWTIGPPDGPVQLRHAKGLSHIVRLLAAPRVEFHALDLVAVAHDRGASDANAAASGMEIRPPGGGDAGPVLDAQAKAEYRARVGELQEEIEEAESFNDPERLAQAREELSFLLRELAGAVGLHGRDRRAGSEAERARVNVTRAIRTALKRIGEHDPGLARSLGSAIRTGLFCVYEPVPGEEPVWDLRGP
ncbi:MAG TPA: AAA family ATPase [Solirubrobacteraceae bacterium]